MNRTTKEITRTQIVRFAGAAGDFNPMHHDEPYAHAAGQPSVFAMGQLSAAILGAAVAGWVGRDNVAAYGVRFTDKVWPGDRLEIECEPVGEGRYELTMSRASDSAVVVTGWARTRTAAGTSERESAIRSS
jgi:acyl dehydratase